MSHYKGQILACDLFTVETFFLQTLYVFFFIELGSRRIHFAGCTKRPTSAWVNQQARQLVWDLEGHSPRMHFLIHDNDSKFTEPFDTIFASQQIHIIYTPVRAPNANAFADDRRERQRLRWVRTVRHECLDRVLIFIETYLRQVLREYITYYNSARPHQALAQQTLIPRTIAKAEGPVRCRRVLSGIQNDYYQDAA